MAEYNFNTWQELHDLAEEADAYSTFNQTADIDLYTEFLSKGLDIPAVKATYQTINGNNHVINNVWFKESARLFAIPNASQTYINNMIFRNMFYAGNGSTAYMFTLAYKNSNLTMNNCGFYGKFDTNMRFASGYPESITLQNCHGHMIYTTGLYFALSYPSVKYCNFELDVYGTDVSFSKWATAQDKNKIVINSVDGKLETVNSYNSEFISYTNSIIVIRGVDSSKTLTVRTKAVEGTVICAPCSISNVKRSDSDPDPIIGTEENLKDSSWLLSHGFEVVTS